MSPDEKRPTSAPDVEAERIAETVHRLILMRETGPKSAAWHRARVQTIWRLQQKLAAPSGPAPSQDAEQRQRAEAEHDQPAEPVDPAQPAHG
jgi:uncharacterized coiled-coil DUF342 family protein